MAKTSDKIDLIQEKVNDIAETLHKIDKDAALQKAAFEDHLKQDELMYQEFKRMNDILQQNTDSLREHMHRTELLETMMINMDKRLSPIEVKHIEKEAILKYNKEKLMLLAKVIGIVGTLVAAYLGITNILS
jgi:hypothetical protein